MTERNRGISRIEIEVGSLYADIWESFSDMGYIKLSEHIWGSLFQLHEPLAEYIHGKNVLDAGCGGGSGVLMMLREGAATVTGVDVSSKALEHCTRIVRKACQDQVDRVTIVNTSVLDLPFEDEMFDFVYSNGVLHHTSDPQKGFSELVRCLKPGGTIWIGLYGAGGLMTGFLIPLARMFRHIIPVRLTRAFLELFTRDKLSIYRVIDPMYTPYRFAYRPKEVLEWFEEADLTYPFRTYRCSESFYKFGSWMSGEGWIGYRAHKPIL